MPPKTPASNDIRSDTPVSTDSGPKRPSGIVEIAAGGDLVLHVAHDVGTSTQTCLFRVDTSILRSQSKYFAGLLSGRFGESERIAKEHAELKRRHESFAKVDSYDLPMTHIEDIGRISAKSIEPLLHDFLLVLHGKELQSQLPVANLANLAIVADRFDTLECVRAYTRRKKLLRTIDAKTTPKIDQALSEEKVRQRVLVALLLDYAPWLEKYSTRLIVKGWVGAEPDDTAALWWDLPLRVEEELAVRRESILDTLQSLQAHFVGQYLSRERQCRLGYDSSAQCDAFQLGEMLRFFSRIGTLAVHGTILNSTEEAQPFEGDINTLIDTMKGIGEPQIDRNHTHCGIRTKFVPLLNFLEDALLHIGICPDCWATKRVDASWSEAKRPLLWKKQTFRWQNPGCKDAHSSARTLFTATQRDWTS